MKAIIAGVTGLVGGAMLKQCINHPELASSEKVQVVIRHDFSQYLDELMEKLAGAEACLWYASRLCGSAVSPVGQCLRSIGGTVRMLGGDVAYSHKVNVDFALAAARAFASKLTPLTPNKRFRFVYCSGLMAQRNVEKPMWTTPDSRRQKGLAENGLMELAKQFAGFEPHVAQPGKILPENAGLLQSTTQWLLPALSINVVEVPACMVDLAWVGSDTFVRNATLAEQGRKLLTEWQRQEK
ncbi:hypothetical protein EJ06DRAFT_550071 [Trichodelitschia bisporula]|uniref:NAD(P)-binding domain-containing protein n=1 Tax=Trichodelitschia bisporula TaxID=703511 RepID=A0A6G1HS06_9PEZI|nr:hypothetical protein EJ06DRAFT_550071 [Trichodelitschia bisporula]